jgi:acetyl-CoA C-acetyltransferase
MKPDTVVILSAARTPIGRFQGAYAQVSATELGAHAIRAAVERAGIGSAMVDECIMGNVVSAGLGQAPARQAAIGGGLADSVSALTINKVCGSSLKAVMLASAMIKAGDARMIVAGGMEQMSGAPYLLPNARSGYRLGHGELTDALIHDGLWCAFEHHHMGHSAEWIANHAQISRVDQDAWALQSHQRAIYAQDTGVFREELVPIEVQIGKGQSVLMSADEPPRRDTSGEQLAMLRPAFVPGGSVTAGNAPGLTDGAAALVVTHAALAADLGIQPIAQIVGYAQAAVKPLELFTAPVFAIQKLLKQTNTTLADYDLFEINEAFAAQVLANARALALDLRKLNVFGGAIALGHPIGASGARVLTTLIHGLRQRGGGRGIAALCLGGGEAVAMAVEAVEQVSM